MLFVTNAGAVAMSSLSTFAPYAREMHTSHNLHSERCMRARRFLVLWCMVACGGGGPTASSDDGNNDDPGTGTGTARVVLTVRGSAGTEVDMTVRYVVADGPTTRAAAAAMTPVPFGCFADISPTCPIDVPIGKTITFFAIEGEGYVAADAGNGRPVPAPDPRRHEFVSFVGDCANNTTLGDCSLHVTANRQYNVRADFALMQSVIFGLSGAGALRYTFTARDRIAFPNRPYQPPASGGNPNGAVYVPAAPLVYGYLPTGSTVTATRQHTSGALSLFIQWSGPCSGGSGGVTASCTQIVGASPTPTSTAVFEYFDCGSQGYSDGGTGPNPPPNCTKVRPP